MSMLQIKKHPDLNAKKQQPTENQKNTEYDKLSGDPV